MLWRVGEGDPYALLSALWTEEKGVGPLPGMSRLPGGKPFFPDFPQVHFSVSHSRGLSLCALSDSPVGADVELVRPRKPGLPRYALSDREFAWFEAKGSRWEDFYTLWTLKEARVKCTGEGLRRPPREIAVPLLEPGARGELEGFSFLTLAGEGWRGALCVRK